MRNTPCTLIIIMAAFSIGHFISTPASAQPPAGGEQPTTTKTTVDPERLANYIRVIEGELERAEGRANSVTTQLVYLDDDIESLIKRIVSLLSSSRDSNQGPGTRIRMMKKDLLKKLKASTRYYAHERDKRQKEMGNRFAQLDNEDLSKDVTALNKRIEIRIAQSIDITASLTRSKEGNAGTYRSWNTDYSNKSKEFKKTQKDANASTKIKAELIATLRAGIDKLTRENNTRETELRLTKDPQKQNLLLKDMDATRQMIEIRRNQIEQVMTKSKSTRPVSSKAAFETDKLLNDMTANLRKDFMKFRSLVNERDTARARVKPLKERLAKAKATQKKTNSTSQKTAP